MVLDIVEALKTGVDRTLKRNAAILAGVFFVVNLVNTVLSNSLIIQVMQGYGFTTEAGYSLALSISPVITAPLLLLGFIASILISVAALRTFVSSETQVVPREYFQRKIGWVTANLVVGGLFFSLLTLGPVLLAVGLGWILMLMGSSALGILVAVLGGLVGLVTTIYLTVSLVFWNVFVAVEDQSFVQGLRNSWNTTRGNRFYLFGLGLVVVLISIGVSLVTLPVELILGATGMQGVSTVVSLIPTSITSVFSLATLAAAYRQLTQ